MKWSGGKVDSLYIPSVRGGSLPTPLVIVIALAIVGTVGAVVGSLAGWIYAAWIF